VTLIVTPGIKAVSFQKLVFKDITIRFYLWTKVANRKGAVIEQKNPLQYHLIRRIQGGAVEILNTH